MKTPNIQQLSRLYYELGKIGARAVGENKAWDETPQSLEALLALAADWSRYDARLFGILVDYCYDHWKNINPLLLRQNMQQMQTPQTLLVIFNFIYSSHPNTELEYYYNYLTKGYKPLSTQLYFMNLYGAGTPLMEKAATESLKEYLDWGFLAREKPILYGKNRETIGHWAINQRENILKRILKEKKTITLSEYLTALDHSLSRQQALIDLQNYTPIKSISKGRASYWTLR
ncbi:hypothetical protein K1X76_02965 [bacterium]|nr:hypothetical protein [bacterium]